MSSKLSCSDPLCCLFLHISRYGIAILYEVGALLKQYSGCQDNDIGKEKARASWARFRDMRKLPGTSSKCSHPGDGPVGEGGE